MRGARSSGRRSAQHRRGDPDALCGCAGWSAFSPEPSCRRLGGLAYSRHLQLAVADDIVPGIRAFHDGAGSIRISADRCSEQPRCPDTVSGCRTVERKSAHHPAQQSPIQTRAVLLLLGLVIALAPVLHEITSAQAGSGDAADLPAVLVSRQLLAARRLSVGDVVLLAQDASGAEPRRFRIAGAYEPIPDPIRLTSQRLEVRLHLPDLLALTAAPDDPAADAVSAINIALADPGDAEAFARDLSARVPMIGARASRNADADGNPFVVLERFHLAIALLTVTTSAVFLLALMVMLVDERRETVGVLRLIGFSRRRILLQVLVEGAAHRRGGRAVRRRAGGGRRAPSTGSSSGATTPRWSSCASRRPSPGVRWRSPCRSAIAASVAASWALLRAQRPDPGAPMKAAGLRLAQPGPSAGARVGLGILGMAAVGALLFDMLLLSRGLRRLDARAARRARLRRPRHGHGRRCRSAAAASSGRRHRRGHRGAARSGRGGAVPHRARPRLLRPTDRPPAASRSSRSAAPTGGRGRSCSGGDLPAASDRTRRRWSSTRRWPRAWALDRRPRLTLRGRCDGGASILPPVAVRVAGVVQFPFDDDRPAHRGGATSRDARSRCAAATARTRPTCSGGVAPGGRARRGRGGDPRRLRPDLHAFTNDEVVARFAAGRVLLLPADLGRAVDGHAVVRRSADHGAADRLGEPAARRDRRAARARASRAAASPPTCCARRCCSSASAARWRCRSAWRCRSWLDRILQAHARHAAQRCISSSSSRARSGVHVALLAATALAAALYPMWLVARLPIAATLRSEVVS